ncbi:MAG: NHL repeat-containing protein [Ignavibacteriae bacterium]|nr:NHL repeat-containing protein [Ignavibacteriota bacterium]
MRSFSVLLTLLLLAPALMAQNTPAAEGWIVDDFQPGELGAKWAPAAGKWSVTEKGATVSGGPGEYALLHGQILMRTKPYSIEARLHGSGAGLIFCAESPSALPNSHVVYLSGSTISTGYMDFYGKYVETRVVDFIQPQDFVTVRVEVDQMQKNYRVYVQDKEYALEELRFISGHSGLFARKSQVYFDSFKLLGKGKPDAPTFYQKSNTTQLDNLSYMTMLDDAIFISNPLVGIVQRLTSIGKYANEYNTPGSPMLPLGLCVDDDRTLYVVDGNKKCVHVFNKDGVVAATLASELNDPRAVAVGPAGVYVLDAAGIKVYDKKGSFVAAKAAGLFKDPRNIFFNAGMLYVADFGNAQVQILDAGDMSVKRVIKENLVAPMDAAVDPSTGDVYVADPGAGVVFHYTTDGSFVERIDPITIKGFVSPRTVRIRGAMIYVGDFKRILGFRKGVLTIRPALRID